jgi:nicotinate-nucleotide pyrophosphorylase (carboxylating)
MKSTTARDFGTPPRDPSSDSVTDLNEIAVRRIVRQALQEDLGSGDLTTEATVGPEQAATARIVAKEAGVACGIEVARIVFDEVDPTIRFEAVCKDGDAVAPGDQLLRVSGPARGLVTAERVALNFMQRMSGIATAASRMCAIAAPYGVRILDTRKTAPGLRLFDKYSVRMGGASNLRLGLYDMALIKENHVALAGGVTSAIRKVKDHLKAHSRSARIEVEVETREQLEEALAEDVDYVMLDNFTLEQIREGVELARRMGSKAELEVSGNVTLANLPMYAATGVQRISTGALTHSVIALDLSMLVD